MLFILLVKASKNSEAGNRPPVALMDAMSRFNEELIQAGVRIMARGLHPSSNALRIYFPIEGGEAQVMEGPLPSPEELIAGFILIDVQTKAEAIQWAKRMPDPQGFGEGQIELRQVY